jgi:hypothetical protein
MALSRILMAVVSACLAWLYIYDACFGETGVLLPTAGTIVAHRWADPDEFRPTMKMASATAGEATPAARVRETFAMFIPGDARGTQSLTRPLGAARPQG